MIDQFDNRPIRSDRSSVKRKTALYRNGKTQMRRCALLATQAILICIFVVAGSCEPPQNAGNSEPRTPTISETINYLNGLVDSGFVQPTAQATPGRFSYEENAHRLWWSRYKKTDYDAPSGQRVDIAEFAGADVRALTPEGVKWNAGYISVDISCANDARCWQNWGKYIDYPKGEGSALCCWPPAGCLGILLDSDP